MLGPCQPCLVQTHLLPRLDVVRVEGHGVQSPMLAPHPSHQKGGLQKGQLLYREASRSKIQVSFPSSSSHDLPV